MITVVGMGRKKGDLTADGLSAIENAEIVAVKSRLTHVYDTVASIRSDLVSFDGEMQAAEDFDQLNKAIADKLQSFGDRKIVFCVAGDGAGDSVVQSLPRVDKVIAGVGLYASAVGRDMRPQTVIYTAQELCLAKRVLPLPTVVTGIFDKYIASEVQLRLLEIFDCDNEVIFAKGNTVKTVPLCELVKQRFDSQTSIYVLPRELSSRQAFGYYDCADIMEILRSPNGCPWDREQTHKSIVKNVIEEAYELANALQNDDVPNIVEELGDLLMQVLFHLEIGQENGEFRPYDVYTALCRKLIDRHPHVFGNVKANNSAESLDVWNAQKLKEHKIKSLSQNVLDVPRNMSALMRAQKIQSRASKGNFDFDSKQQIIDKLQEELQEFLTASDNDRLMEGGDLLFVAVNLLRFCGVDSETALLESTDKFVRRVVECERILEQNGQVLKDLSLDEFDEIWAEAKRNVG